MKLHLYIAAFCLPLVACSTPVTLETSQHIVPSIRIDEDIPQPVQRPILPPPRPQSQGETFSVSVYKVPAKSLLFALARDAKINADIHPAIEGDVTLNALNQTLPQLLARISKQVDIRYEFTGKNLAVLPDTPFLRNYQVDYVNIARETASKVNVATQISTPGAASQGSTNGDNNSTTTVSNVSNNQFWKTLIANIRDILADSGSQVEHGGVGVDSNPAPQTIEKADQSQGNGQSKNRIATSEQGTNVDSSVYQGGQRVRTSESVIANPETGLITVRATSRQHEKIRGFLDLVLASAKRQVLIEATVLEVELADQYQQGINWSALRTGSNVGFNVAHGQVGGQTLPSGIQVGATPGIFVLNYSNPTSAIGNIAATIQLLESFGKVKVLSSPKISVLNNQTALLKVVDNRVYFTIKATTQAASINSAAVTTYTSELHTVPVGFVMSVTPQVAENDEVTMNVRPTISRIISYVQDPNPALAQASVVSSVPVIQTRELESILKVRSGQTAVMGGLMQDTVNSTRDAVPGVSRIPVLGDALSYRNDTKAKTELVIFMRPHVIKETNAGTDYSQFKELLNQNRFPTSQLLPMDEPTLAAKEF